MAKIVNFTPQESQITNGTSGSIDSIGGFKLDSEFKPKLETNPDALYAVNWNSLQRVEDLILVLASIGFVFSPQHGHFERIKHLLDLENPIIPQQPPVVTGL